MNQERKNIVIIGCGAAGGTTAQFARKTDRNATITLIEKGAYPQYSKCGLPYAIAGVIPKIENLIEFSEEWFKKEHIELLLNTTIERIDLHQQTVYAKQGAEHLEKHYNKLILATGATPWIPPIQNIQKNGQLLHNTHMLRTLDDGKNILANVHKGKHAVVIGAGLIGLEMADTLHKKGMKVTVVEALPHILATTLDDDMNEQVLQTIQENITVYTNHYAIRVEHQQNTIQTLIIKDATTQEEKQLPVDLLILATGTKPEVTLAKSIGCIIGKTGGIQVNERSETSLPHVYAAGDCTEYKDFVTHEPLCAGLGSIAVRQGIAAGINAAGGAYTLPPGVLLSRTSEFFGLEIAAVGPTQTSLQNTSLVTGKFNGSSLPEYFPGGEPITIKVAADENTGKILYAQAIGKNAGQRINVYACAILKGATIDELKKLETTYAPPIAPTLDAVTLACDVASLKLARKRRSP
ncbi:MAG: FAD-dependent oxidoreductase [Methanobacteriota archaeon]